MQALLCHKEPAPRIQSPLLGIFHKEPARISEDHDLGPDLGSLQCSTLDLVQETKCLTVLHCVVCSTWCSREGGLEGIKDSKYDRHSVTWPGLLSTAKLYLGEKHKQICRGRPSILMGNIFYLPSLLHN